MAETETLRDIYLEKIDGLRSELEQVKKERDEWQRAADENVRTLGGVIERANARYNGLWADFGHMEDAYRAANARTERAIELRKYASHTDKCQIHYSDRTCTCGLSDLLRDLKVEETENGD